MPMFGALLQIIVVFGLMGIGVYYFIKKMRTNQFNKMGDKGRIKVVDGVNLTYQTSSYLLNVDGQQVLVVLSPNWINTLPLKDKSFGEMINSGFADELNQEKSEVETYNESE